MINEKVKFENSNEVVNKFVDIIAPTFGLKTGAKLFIKGRLKLSSDEELRQCLTNVLKFLVAEYKK